MSCVWVSHDHDGLYIMDYIGLLFAQCSLPSAVRHAPTHVQGSFLQFVSITSVHSLTLAPRAFSASVYCVQNISFIEDHKSYTLVLGNNIRLNMPREAIDWILPSSVLSALLVTINQPCPRKMTNAATARVSLKRRGMLKCVEYNGNDIPFGGERMYM
jgi:hypothetical protein